MQIQLALGLTCALGIGCSATTAETTRAQNSSGEAPNASPQAATCPRLPPPPPGQCRANEDCPGAWVECAWGAPPPRPRATGSGALFGTDGQQCRHGYRQQAPCPAVPRPSACPAAPPPLVPPTSTATPDPACADPFRARMAGPAATMRCAGTAPMRTRTVARPSARATASAWSTARRRREQQKHRGHKGHRAGGGLRGSGCAGGSRSSSRWWLAP
jgi:hypothetical protein